MQIQLQIYCALLCKANPSFDNHKPYAFILFSKTISNTRMKNQYHFLSFCMLQLSLLKSHYIPMALWNTFYQKAQLITTQYIRPHYNISSLYHKPYSNSIYLIHPLFNHYPFNMQFTYYPIHSTNACLNYYSIFIPVHAFTYRYPYTYI